METVILRGVLVTGEAGGDPGNLGGKGETNHCNGGSQLLLWEGDVLLFLGKRVWRLCGGTLMYPGQAGRRKGPVT